MVRYDLLLLSAVFVPLAGACILPLAGRVSLRLRNALALGFILVPFAASLRMIAPVLRNEAIPVNIPLVPGISLVFLADGLAVFMACVSSLISAIIVLYSFGYISHYENQNEYYSMVTLFIGAMMGLIFAAHLILLYIFWEITAITSWRLIGFFREKEYVLKADKAFLVTVFGALAMLIGFIIIYQQAGSFEFSAIKASLKGGSLTGLTVLLILVGIFSKSATLPFHTWLPDAGVAPSPVTALLHAAILVKIGVYVFARLFVVTFPVAAFWHTAVPVIALASAIVSAGAALVETDLKRLIAYSTISQIGFIFFGLAVGNLMAVAGGLLYILMHGIAKAGLFLCAGIIEQNTKIRDITKLGGLITTMPVTAVSFLCCAFSVMGIPPFGGFFSKYLVFAGAIEAGQLWISFAFLLCAFLTILYLFRVFNLVFLGQAQAPWPKESSPVMVASVALLALLSLLSGIFINYPAGFAQAVTAGMLGMAR
ncbi:MAG TPA: NADH-quinone oxidoreductase subunit L [Patescibacteria group bacterium]|nr:NADH-quinone oxidoreductase subunit L [Patescibacteria group bacterium]